MKGDHNINKQIVEQPMETLKELLDGIIIEFMRNTCTQIVLIIFN